ncbi:ParB/RepB/Spo0J family partition protein [Actinocrispum wychmicini]|uniref:ParB-like chromosome segregation protein Spo0J n=1 Tax=Actinocrispum wychmicini TaxID=1213861 RepID=A0A4R2JQ68_9PSEU|nr:ParB N-terminal domain-containing protein [Actinocrispum wychmicini]TCO62353.1 ParB-like chromosome segregation protein Spo0J [Actinocrispum wychmicini]
MSHHGGVASWTDCSEERVLIDSLLPADSPRLCGESQEHARILAASEAVLPPIVVHRSTMRVIDGMHRVRAAALRGENEILVRFYEGDDDDAFIIAVETNIAHGLPLSLADRTAAATRIVVARPQWSDRRIAAVTGLAASTVGGIRRRSTEHGEQPNNTRVGRDGKVRPTDRTSGRLRASEFIKDRPKASVREIARAAGVSPATALDVRNRLRDGLSPVPDGKSAVSRKYPAPRSPLDREMPSVVDSGIVLQDLKKDPSLRFTEIGRALLRWLDTHTAGLEMWKEHADNIPAHSKQAIARLARQNSDAWTELAVYLERYRKTPR